MYAIVHKNRVILGPMEWSQKYFTSVLKIRHRIEANVPGIPPEILPWQINDDTAIHTVQENRPEFDPMTQGLEGPFWDLSEPTIVANYNLKDQSIESARNNFRIIAANERYKKEVSGVKVTIQDTEVTADTSRDGRNIFLQKLLLMQDDEIARWKFPEGWLSLSKQELGFVVATGAAHIQSAFDWESAINDQIDAANTGEELHAIEIIEEKEERFLDLE